MKGNKKYVAGAVLLAGFVLGSGSLVYAQMQIEPMIVTGYRYDSNFWSSEENESAVGTIEVKPGVKMTYDTGKTQVTADAALEAYMYHDYDTPDEGVADADDDNYLGAAVIFSLLNQTTDRLSLGLDENFSLTRDPAGADAFSNSVDREKYLLNRFSPNAYYELGERFGLGANYENLLTDYADDGEDSMQNLGGLDLYYNLTRQSAVYLSYEYWMRDYDQTSTDYTSNRVKLNYEQQINYLTLSAGAGYHNRSFDNDTDDLDAFSWNITVDWQNPPQPATEPKTFMNLTIAQDLNDAGDGDSYYTATRAEGEVGHIFQEKFVTSLGGYIQESDYELYLGEASDRSDTTYSVNGTVGYKFWRNGQLNFEVGYTDRDSDLAGSSYSNTYGLVSLDFGLDLGRL